MNDKPVTMAVERAVHDALRDLAQCWYEALCYGGGVEMNFDDWVARTIPLKYQIAKAAFRAGQRAALLEAAEYIARNLYDYKTYSEELRRMAEELK